MPRPPAEAEILLERDASGRVKAASIAWQNLLGEPPSSVAVSFDGRPIAVDALRRVVIPAYAPEVSHILTVELEFESGMSSRDDLAIGGAAGEEAKSELTAVPVRRPGKGRLEPRAFEGMLRSGGKPLRIATVEEGSATLWIVRDENALGAYRKLRASGGDAFGRLFSNAALPLKKEDSVHFLWPRPRGIAGAGTPTALFPSSQEFTRKDGGLAFLLEHIANTEPAGLFPMYTDAVAVAGLNAFESFGRRAVLLVLGESPTGPLDPQAARWPPVSRAPPRAALRVVPRSGAARGFALGPRRRSRHEPRHARSLRAAANRPRLPGDRLGRGPPAAPGDRDRRTSLSLIRRRAS